MRRFITVFTVCAAAACGPAEEEAAPRIPLQDELATTQQEVRRRIDDDGIIIMNGLDPAVLGENYLLNNATNRATFISKPLTTASFTSGPLVTVLANDSLRSPKVLEYVVRCALSPDDAPVVAAGRTMTGEAGLCRAWASGPITTNVTCQRQVSACLFALSNVVGAHVPVSIRGVDAMLSAAPEVRPYSMTSTGVRHPVFASCGVNTAGVQHNCGWQPVDDAAADAAGIAKVFSCRSGTTVRVGAGSSCTGTTLGSMTPGSDKVLRVCSGIGPCNGPTAADPTPAGFLGQRDRDSCGTIKPEVIFTCPASGQYVVMQRDYYVQVSPPRVPGTMTVGHLGSLGAASEAAVFSSREGAFFGSLFTGPLGRSLTWNNATQSFNVTYIGKTVFPGAYSCEDELYTDALAYRSARLCSLTAGQCLTTWTGVCQGDATRAAVCDGLTAPTGAFFACWSPSGVKYDEGLTTYLRTPCDLIGGSAACKQSN